MAKLFDMPTSDKAQMLIHLKTILDVEFKKDFDIRWDKKCEYLVIRLKKKQGL